MPIFAPFHLFDALAVSIQRDFILIHIANVFCVSSFLIKNWTWFHFLEKWALASGSLSYLRERWVTEEYGLSRWERLNSPPSLTSSGAQMPQMMSWPGGKVTCAGIFPGMPVVWLLEGLLLGWCSVDSLALEGPLVSLQNHSCRLTPSLSKYSSWHISTPICHLSFLPMEFLPLSSDISLIEYRQW
jgi:hypothetical protein